MLHGPKDSSDVVIWSFVRCCSLQLAGVGVELCCWV